MSEQTLNVKILLRNDTSANWKTKNPVLENGELGIETDTKLMKFGDGTSTWTNLNYIDAQIANNVAWSGVTNKPSTYPPADHNHDSSYPSITGDRASGTWGINISGNAVSSTNASHASTADNATHSNAANHTDNSISFKHPDGSNTSFNGNTAVDMTGGVYYAKESSHAVNADEATHAASATTVNVVAPIGQTKDLVSGFMAATDGFRIRVGDTGGDNGYVEIATADNGNEPIYVRQYTFVNNGTNGTNQFATLAHQVTLLDNNGNSDFSGTVTAPTFSGHLAGTADNATNADTVDGKHASDFALAANVYDNAGAHNAMFRGKNITANFTSGAFSTAVANGTFTDIYPGDYIQMPITINGTTKTYDIVIGDCDYHLHRGDTETTKHHVLVFTRTYIGNEHMNATNTTAGGYIGSDMWKTILPKYTTAIKNAFGSSHILTHRELLSNAESDTVSSAAGAGWSGGTTDWGWYDVDVNLFNEPMVYGCRPFSSSGFDIGDCDTQLAAMRHDKSLSFTRTYWYWLRAVVSSSCFAFAGSDGIANYNSASLGDGGVRVYFLLY